MINTTLKEERVIYTVIRQYSGSCSIQKMIGAIIQSHNKPSVQTDKVKSVVDTT